MYKNPTPCGVNAWRSFDSNVQMECIDPLDAASNMPDDYEDDENAGTPTDATAVNPYTSEGADDAALGRHPARRRLCGASSGDEALPNRENPTAGLPIAPDYEGMFFSMHLGARLSAEFLEGLNDNYMALSASMRFMSFPAMSMELAVIPTQGLSMGFHFKINVWEILSGIVDLLVATVIAFMGAVIGYLTAGLNGNIIASESLATQTLTKALDILKDAAKDVIRVIVDAVLEVGRCRLTL
jgi:hypothetical protein